ncbi:helix-turn-helix transcriptional regulator [Paenibacillus radicis (ex Xue et al. 2023)]|uniref:LuxR C-terminal-related transcriptional regulator n=1 Tax=Paenibacillus radicis (ex Xue et al. 2023) TaxID=2972489 RepID=A0ABT1YNS9_9BACL|nr:LuxR C-terminal-related transcriptional regulator [Paenibacillus radicis (ex Xue et al. 2023)]MCR8634840.1 LuxR C-terminal-related transcriptional regulator [Paenibacillus radicis (ex Xue et al. 2023)]
MLEEVPYRRIVNRIDPIEQHYLVGRDKEVKLFLEMITADSSDGKILNLYGTGGVGKSYLLNEFRRLSEQVHVEFILLDSRVSPRSPSEFCLHLLRMLRHPVQKIEQTVDLSQLTETCLGVVLEAAAHKKVVLAVDTFEGIGDMEHWLRDKFLAYLKPEIIVIISGRIPLQGLWLSSPAWRQFIHRMPLADLDYYSVKQYLELSGIEQEEMIPRIWSQTKGHPLTLALLVSTTIAQNVQQAAVADGSGFFTYIVQNWLTEVPGPEMRAWVEAAAVLRYFNQEILSYVMEKEIATETFQSLVGLSFIQRVGQGWLLHDLLRDAISYELRLRMPDSYNRLWKRCVLYYYERIKKSARKRSVAWENTELFYYIGNRLIQSAFYQQSVSYSSEPLNSSNRAEAERYIENRYLYAKDVQIKLTDPDTKDQLVYMITREYSLYGLKHIHLGELYDLDPNSVKLTRDSQGTVCGLSVIIPINEHTVDYLLSKPLSSAYFNSLSESELKELRVSKHLRAGYFVKTLDVYDSSDVSMLQSMGFTFITHMLDCGYVVAAPPPYPFASSILQSLGCEMTKDVVHFDYDNKIPTPLFVIDTRGNKLQQYLDKMIDSFGILEEKNGEDAAQYLLTPKEKGVIELIVKGCSNLEIAELLFLRETTVKKHVSNIFKKLDVKKRVQLINKYLINSNKN